MPINSPYTNDELQGAEIDTNPAIECSECDHWVWWKDIKDKDDHGGWRLSGDPSKPPLCPGCMAAIRNHERRLTENQHITEFC